MEPTSYSIYDQLEALRVESGNFLSVCSSYLAPHPLLLQELESFFKELETFCEECSADSMVVPRNEPGSATAICSMLTSFQSLWESSIYTMQSSLKHQRALGRHMSAEADRRLTSIHRDLAETTGGVPSLNLASLRPTLPRVSARSSSTFKYSEESELISHRSPFTGRSKDLSSRPKRNTPPLPPVHSIHSESELSIDLKNWQSFDKKDPDESIHVSDVKKAIKILTRAKVLNNNQLLLKLAEAAKDPDNSINLDALLQNLSFSRNSRKKGKPPTPRSRRTDDNLAVTSPKGLLSPSGNFQHTLLSSEQLYSARDQNFTLDIDVSKGSMGEIGLDELLDFPDASVEYRGDCAQHSKDLMMSDMDSGYRLSRNSVTKESTANSSARVTHKWRPILSVVEDTRVRAVK